MNKYTLELKNSKIRRQYDAEDLVVCQKHIRNIFIVMNFTVIAQLILLGLKDNQSYKIFVYFILYLVGVTVSYLVSLINIHRLRIVHTFSILLYITLILWSFIDDDLKQELEAEKSITPFVRGFFLCTQFYVYNVSSYFPVQAFMYIYIFVLLLSVASQNPLIDSIKLIPTLITILYKNYFDDLGKKRRFLLQKKDDVWDHLTNELLPTSLIIVKWDEQSNRVEFYSQNKQSQKVFKLQNTEDFNEFSRKFVLEEINEKIKRQRSLRKSEIKWDNTLLYQVQKKIEKEKIIFDNCDEPHLMSQKDLSDNNFFRKFAGQTVKQDNNNNNPLKKSVSNATLSYRKGNNSKNKLDQLTEQYSLKQEKEQLGKIDYYIGEHRQTNFEISGEGDRYSVRISAYFLNDWYGVISIENESFRERYMKQKKQYTQLVKQVNENYDYLLHCSRTNIENTKELYQKILSQQSHLQKFENKQSTHNKKGQVVSENNLCSYIADKSILLDSENTLREQQPIQECSSYLENKSPVNNKNNSLLLNKNIKNEIINQNNKQTQLFLKNNQPPPTFGIDTINNNNNRFNINYNNEQMDQNLDQSSKNINSSLFIKKNHKSSIQGLDFQNLMNNQLYNNNDYQEKNITSENNGIIITNNQQNRNGRIDIDAMNDNDCTPISAKVKNNPLKQILNQIHESTKAMFTAILIKTVIMNQIACNTKHKKNHQIIEQDSLKSIKKANLKQVIQNIASLFKCNLIDKGSDISIHYDQNLPTIVNSDQSKLSQLLFNCLNLMVLNIQPTYKLSLNVLTESNSEESQCQLNTPGLKEQNNNNFMSQEINQKQHQQSQTILQNNQINGQIPNSNDNQDNDKNQQQNNINNNNNNNNNNHHNLNQQKLDDNKVIKIIIKGRLNDLITSQIAKQKELKLNILENGIEQAFAKNAIHVSQQIIKEIGPYSKIQFSFDPTDLTFSIQLNIYSDLYVLIQRKSIHQQKQKLNPNNNLNNPPLQLIPLNTHNLNKKLNPYISSTQPNNQIDPQLGQLGKSYNIMNISEENFLKTKDENFLKVQQQNVNCRTILRLDSQTLHQDTINQIRTQTNVPSPISQIHQNSSQKISIFSQVHQDQQFQQILAKSKNNHKTSQQNIIHSQSLANFDVNTQPHGGVGNNSNNNNNNQIQLTQPSFIQKQYPQSVRHQEFNSSQEMSQNQQRSIIIHNSTSNMVIQNTNITLD